MNAPKFLIHLMLALLFTHELDAVAQSEWRLLYVLRSLSDEQGRLWFVALHVPLFLVLIVLTSHTSAQVQKRNGIGLSLFSIIHALLHWRLSGDPLSTFSSPLSLSLILGAAVSGAVYLSTVAYSARSRTSSTSVG